MSAYNPVSPALALAGYEPIIIIGPEGSPNGSLVADPQAVVFASDGSVFIKSTGQDEFGWTQIL